MQKTFKGYFFSKTHWTKRLVYGFGLLLLLPLLSACTANNNYSADKKLGVFFNVPKDWKQVPSDSINNALIDGGANGAATLVQETRFLAAYSPKSGIDPREYFQSTAPSSPILLVRVTQLQQNESDALSINALRNHVVPLLTSLSSSANLNSGISLIDDHYLDAKGGHGIFDTFQWQNSKNQTQQLNQQILLSKDHQYLYVFLLRANVSDLNKYGKEMEKIIKSFTVNGPV